MSEKPAWAVRLSESRREHGWTQREMAKRLAEAGGDTIRLPERESLIRRIKDWEAGRHRPKDPYPMLYRRVFGADVFSTQSPSPDHGCAQVTAVTITSPDLPWVWEPRLTADAVHYVTRSDLMLDRREAVKALAVTAGLPLLDPVQRWLDSTPAVPAAVPAAGRIGVDEVARLEATANVFRTWDDSHGGGLARKAVIGQLNEVADLLRDNHSREITQRLMHVMAQLAKISATMSWDCGMQTAAQKYYALALQAAKPTGDRPFGASILASMARQLLYLNQPQDALELVRLALDGVRSTATPRLRAMLHTREAWAYASLGRPEAFRRATAAAEDTFAEVRSDDADPEWIAYFDEAELAGVTGGRYLDLSRLDTRYAAAALTYISGAVELRKKASIRSLALDQVGLALAHLVSGDLDQAVSLGSIATETAGQVQSDRVRVQLREFYLEITTRPDPTTAQLGQHIRETLRGSTRPGGL